MIKGFVNKMIKGYADKNCTVKGCTYIMIKAEDDKNDKEIKR